jgi:hypothetical protein
MATDYYQSRDTRPHKCTCDYPFFHEVYQIDMDGIRINSITKGDLLFACGYCGTVWEVNPNMDGASLKKVWSPIRR